MPTQNQSLPEALAVRNSKTPAIAQAVAEANIKYELTEIDRMVVEMKCRFPNASEREIAKLLGGVVPVTTVNYSLAKPEVQMAIWDLQGTWASIIVKNKEKAARKLVEMLDSNNDAVVLRAIEDILQLNKAYLSTEKELANF